MVIRAEGPLTDLIGGETFPPVGGRVSIRGEKGKCRLFTLLPRSG